MKTSRLDKLEQELVAEEEKVRQYLLRVLPQAAESGSSLFTNSGFNPLSLPAHMFSADAEVLLNNARECVRLREVVGLDQEGSIGAMFLKACREHGVRAQEQ